MIRPLAIQGVDDVMNSVRRFSRDTGMDLLKEIKTTGRTLSVSLAHSTQPYGMALAAKKTGEGAVEKDIRKVFATPSSIYEDLDIKNEDAAKDFWRAFTEKNTFRMLEIVKKEGLYIQQITHAPSESLHETHRKAKGRVYLRMQRAIVLDSKALTTYIKKRQKKVGYAKAGWARAAELLGGLRGFGAWASSRHPTAPGGADISEDPSYPMVTIYNSVPYIRETLPEAEVNHAVSLAYQKLYRRMNIILRRTRRL